MDKTLNIVIRVCQSTYVDYITWFSLKLGYGDNYEFIDIYHPYSYHGHYRDADFKSIRRWLSRSS